MVDRLGALTRAIATLRKSLDAPGADALKRPKAGVAKQTLQQNAPQNPSHVGTLGARLAVLRPDDPKRTKKALRLFIEAVLLDEFGGDLILSADFQRLVDRSLSALEADESLLDTLTQATSELFPHA